MLITLLGAKQHFSSLYMSNTAWGNYVRSHTLEKYEPQTIQMNNYVVEGMCGGPWIIQGKGNMLVYGILSCNTPQGSQVFNAIDMQMLRIVG